MNIEVTREKSQIAVAVRFAALGMDKIAEVMAEGYPKLMGFIAKQGKQIAGAPYCLYTNANEDYTRFDIELGVPVSEAVSVSDEFLMSQTYEGKALAGTHKGSYKSLEAAYCALMDYAKENSIECANECYDYYINNPADTPEGELLTKVIFPIK